MDIDVVNLQSGSIGRGVELDPHQRVRGSGRDTRRDLTPIATIAQPAEARGATLLVGATDEPDDKASRGTSGAAFSADPRGGAVQAAGDGGQGHVFVDATTRAGRVSRLPVQSATRR